MSNDKEMADKAEELLELMKESAEKIKFLSLAWKMTGLIVPFSLEDKKHLFDVTKINEISEDLDKAVSKIDNYFKEVK